jgi:hypothetical protein
LELLIGALEKTLAPGECPSCSVMNVMCSEEASICSTAFSAAESEAFCFDLVFTAAISIRRAVAGVNGTLAC